MVNSNRSRARIGICATDLMEDAGGIMNGPLQTLCQVGTARSACFNERRLLQDTDHGEQWR